MSREKRTFEERITKMEDPSSTFNSLSPVLWAIAREAHFRNRESSWKYNSYFITYLTAVAMWGKRGVNSKITFFELALLSFIAGSYLSCLEQSLDSKLATLMVFTKCCHEGGGGEKQFFDGSLFEFWCIFSYTEMAGLLSWSVYVMIYECKKIKSSYRLSKRLTIFLRA